MSKRTPQAGESAELKEETRELKPKERIQAVGERMFAEEGFEAVSVRALTSAAQVNVASLHYHFGSKEGLLEAIFAARAKPIAEARLAMLRECRAGPDRPPLLNQLLEAFLRPALTFGEDDRFGGSVFARLRARLAVAPQEFSRRVLGSAFDESSRAFIDSLTRALPDLPRRELEWRFHFLLGTMVYSMADGGRIQSITDGACDPSDGEETLRHLLPFLVAGFRADIPEPGSGS
ncbi:TetR/AcrR family transcriptional regulator [Oceanicola sp. 22II-s10i]|uniref:TetR/AcrR family transcriptional regulator n=1 Tax=Oceanicola sp. 22II-s10i TaxID=1317116 RepID=UPI000B521E95|nr:TetR/AcrR family transcriptional regulator [Oceanicola sp. 22II-s10i]